MHPRLMETNSNHIFEAEQIGLYLLNSSIQETEKKKYADAMLKLNISFSEYEQLLWNKMLKNKWHMACIDAALAVQEPTSAVRRKLFTMLAILEASPNYTSYFLSRKYSIFYLFKIGLVGVRAIMRALVGIFIVNTIKRTCN
jgi:hypothetical protein